MAIVAVGIDLAKNVFAVHGVDVSGKPALVRPTVPRAKLLELIASQPLCFIGTKASAVARHWAREFHKFGHIVRLMVHKFVISHRLSGNGSNRPARRGVSPLCCETALQFVSKAATGQGYMKTHPGRLQPES